MKERIRAKRKELFLGIQAFLRDTLYLLKSNWGIVFPFLILYSIVNIVATSALVNLFLRVSMLMHSDTYIDLNNLPGFLTAPTTILALLLLCILVALLHVVEIAGIMHVYSMSMIGKKTTFTGMLTAGVRSGLRGFIPKNWLLILFVMILIPLTGFFTLSFSSLEASVPGFIMDFIRANKIYNTLYFIAYVGMLFAEVTYIFGINYYLLEECSFTAACRKSRKLIKGNYLTTILCFVVISVILYCATTGLSAIISSALVKVIRAFSSNNTTTTSQIAAITLTINTFLTAIIAPALNIAALTHLFFRYSEDRNMLAAMSRNAFHDKKWNKWQIGAVFAAIALIFVAGFVQNTSGLPALTAASERPMIAAHRGDSLNAPENSYPAFELAVMENVDWVELDVHQTKDNVIIVSHDDDLTRISGENLFVHDLTYDEIMQLDVGSWFSKDYQGLRITTLDKALKLMKDKVCVQIEIKPNGMDEGIEERILQIVNDNGMHDQVLIISLQPEPLRRIKALDPTIQTAYCMVLAWEHIEDISFSDSFTLEESNISAALVDRIHKKGGKVFAWTVNSEESVQHLVDCGVDGIVTDNPSMIRNALNEAHYNGGIAKLFRQYLYSLQNQAK